MSDELPKPHRKMTPDEKGKLLLRYVAAQISVARLDFSGTNLQGVNLQRTNLQDAYLPGANLQGVNLWDANLADADLQEATLLGADLQRAYLQRAKLRYTELQHADLQGAYLRNADLCGANLMGANLMGANLQRARLKEAKLQGAKLQGTDLLGADLQEANLRDSNLMGANLQRVNLRNSNLQGANLQRANLQRAKLREANLREANLRNAHLIELSLTPIADTSSCRVGQNPISIGAVARSLRCPNLHSFLVRCGQPEVVATYLIDSLKSLDEADLFEMLQSVFLSYGQPDQVFAYQLRDALQRNGVRIWEFSQHSTPGRHLRGEISNQINDYERMVLICSEASLTRDGVQYELEEILAKEGDQGGRELLIPIILDDFFETEWAPIERTYLARTIRQRVAGDFRAAPPGSKQFTTELSRLLKALEKV